MKLNQFSQNEVAVLGEAQETEFSIDTESLGVLFKGFSDALYSDKFGSIVREITSNCFDAHEEVGQTLDVQIRMVQAGFDEGKIIFEDFGPGLSPERIKNIYSKYFASTKRGTNDQIGGFGIGAKSPLAYADSFNVITRVDGVEYNYIIHKGEQVPIITLIDQSTTDAINGTQVIIPIANSKDYAYFVMAVKDQLRYFDNITYKIPGEDINNDYKIFKGKHWIHTTNGTANSQLQLCIGKVGYPLDWKAAGIEDVYYHQQHGNFALYFDVGEISVTMNRESVEYNSKTRKAIQEKIKAFQEEARELTIKNNRTSDLKTFYEITRHNSTKLRVNDECILESSYFFEKMDAVYEPLEDLGKVVQDPLFFIRVHKSLGFTDKSAPRILKGQSLCRLLFDESNRYHSPRKHLRNAKIFRVRDRMNSLKDAYIQETYGKFVAVKLDSDYRTTLADYYKLKGSSTPNYTAADTYFKHMIKEVVKHTESYDDLIVPEDWIEQYKASRKRGSKIRSAEVIPYKQVYMNSEDVVMFEQNQNKVDKLLSGTRGLLIYGSSKDRNKLTSAFELLRWGVNRTDRSYYQTKLREYTFIMISESRKKLFAGHKNTLDINDFLKEKYSLVSRIYSYDHIMAVPMGLSEVDDVFRTISFRKMAVPAYTRTEFEKAFKFAYNPDNEYITLPNGEATSVTELQDYIIKWRDAHPMCAFIKVISEKEHKDAVHHYINLINFNSKLKCYG